MKMFPLIFLLMAATHLHASPQRNDEHEELETRVCTSSDELMSAEKIECYPENDYLKVSNIKYQFAGEKYDILITKSDDVSRICKNFGAERVHDFTYSKVYLPLTKGYSLEENMVTTKKSDNPALLSVICKFSQLAEVKIPEDEEKIIRLERDYILIKNGKEEISDKELNERTKRAANSFCRANGYVDGFATTIEAPTMKIHWRINYMWNEVPAEFLGSSGIKLRKDGTFTTELLKSHLKYKNRDDIRVLHPIVLKQVTCFKEIR